MVCAVALPLAVASAGQVGDGGRAAVRDLVRPSVRPSVHEDEKERLAAATGSPLLLGLGLATAARCGPDLKSPDGVEAQTCVLTQGDETWARTYYRNATGAALDAVLSLMGPGARSVQMHCVVAADDEPDSCETPRQRTRGAPDDYTAVAEFAARPDDGPLLLRSGSNSGEITGS